MSKAKKQKNANKHRALSAQQTIPYIAMHPDGICQIPGGLYTKTLEYEDINYAVASTEDQTAIISGWSACLNYFDSSLPFQLSFVNRRSRNANRYKVNIPAQEDDFNSIRGEYVEMLKGQIAKSNNGIERYKYITFGLPAEGVTEARPRLGRIEADVMGNLKRLGVQSRPLDGRDRLAVLHGQMHPGGREPFRFAWKDIPKAGMGTKDYIAPDSFDFRQSRTFRVGQMWGAASYLQIMASELSDKLLAEILELDAELTVTMHIQTVDQLKAIKTIKGKISDIGRMKAEEQKKAVRAGYDINDEDSPLSMKADFLLSLCELIVGGKEGLQPIEKTVIDRCVRLVYREMALGLETAKTPLLQDLYEELLRQPEPEARRVATALELYCTGSLNLFNHPTNVDLNSRVVCIVLKGLGENLRKIAMHTTNEFVTAAVNANHAEGVATWCYFDEFHILLRDPLTASYFVAVWKMLRKKGCVPSALTQNVKDLLASREIENILDNTDFMVLLSQAQSDRAILAKQLGISEHQLSYITHSNSGEGLLFYGNVTIPFVDRFPRGEIYDLLTTRPEDLAHERTDE